MGKKIIERKKDEVKTLTPFIETRDCGAIANKTGNLIAKRANQINSKVKEELHKKLEEFASTTDNLEEVFENREQIEISKFYERLPKPVLVALNEFHNDEIYHRPQGETK